MGEFIAGTIQQQVKIYPTPLDYQADIFQFLQMAQAKQARLVVLPALSPLMLVPALVAQTKLDQPGKISDGKGRLPGWVSRLFHPTAEEIVEEAGGVKDDLIDLLTQHPGELYDAYIDLFSAAALKYQMVIVAGSLYLCEHEQAEVRHVSYVFGSNGMVLGRQEKVHLTQREKDFCQPGQVFQVIETPVGNIGLLIEEDALYPECGRILAYNGADILINLTACPGKPTYNQVRNAFLARVDENGTLGMQSCLIGDDLFEPNGQRLAGQAALLQPFQLSDYGDGVMYQVGSMNIEGFIAEPISLDALKDYWIQAKHPLRQEMQMAAYRPLTQVYQQERTLDQVYWNPTGTHLGAQSFQQFSAETDQISLPDLVARPKPAGLVSPFAQDDE